jgi:predicted nucleic acid-binding protein
LRVAARSRIEVAVKRAIEVLGTLDLIELDGSIRRLAARLEPPTLRSLDAIHLATALSLGDELGGFAAYDAGVPVVAPV